MKKAEFTKTADGNHYMDTSVITDVPVKITYLDPKVYVNAAKSILERLDCFFDRDYSKEEMLDICQKAVISLMQAYIGRRCAWIYGEDMRSEVGHENIRTAFTFAMHPMLAADVWYDLDDGRNDISARLLDSLVGNIINFAGTHMNRNPYVVHRLSVGRGNRDIAIEEFSDWRVIQWTQHQQNQIADRHETI